MGPKQPIAGPSRNKMSTPSQAPPPPPCKSAFNASRTYYAMAQPVLGSADKVTVWEIASDRVVAEWELEGAGRVSALVWSSQTVSGARRKRRQKDSATKSAAEEEDVVLIVSDSEAVSFSPRRSEVVQRLPLPSPVTAAWSDSRGVLLATASSLLRLSSSLSSISHSFALPPNQPAPSAICAFPTSSPDSLHVVLGGMSVTSVQYNLSSSAPSRHSSPLPVSTSSVTQLLPLPTSSKPSRSFLVVDADDRTVSQYTLSSVASEPKLSHRFASPTLSPAHSVDVSAQHVSVLNASGEISLFPVPAEVDPHRPLSDSKPCFVRLVEGKDEKLARICRIAFAPNSADVASALLCGRLVGAGRVKWYRAVYENPEGGARPSTIVKCEAQDLVASTNSPASVAPQRFVAPAKRLETIADDTGDEPAATLPTDVDMADLSLGERLLALPNGDASVADGAAPKKPVPTLGRQTNASSLTRLLVQALHTSDSALLSVCLSHRDPTLIRNTIRKMPATMALPLLKACVERLGQGKGANSRSKQRGSAQGEQHGRATVEWVKGVLVERGAILMTMPSLPAHLAALSQTLHTRLQLYQPLLSLSGRLDLALAQITMRRLAAEAANAQSSQNGGEGARYVEGESDSEDDVAVEVDHDGEVEDVDMRVNGYSDDEADEDDSEEGEDDEDDEDEDGELDEDDPLESGSEDGGLLDLEAEEGSDDDEEEDSEED